MNQYTVYIYTNIEGSTTGELNERVLDIYADKKDNVKHVVSAFLNIKKIVAMVVVEKRQLLLTA